MLLQKCELQYVTALTGQSECVVQCLYDCISQSTKRTGDLEP
jgi:hypothetical protein